MRGLILCFLALLAPGLSQSEGLELLIVEPEDGAYRSLSVSPSRISQKSFQSLEAYEGEKQRLNDLGIYWEPNFEIRAQVALESPDSDIGPLDPETLQQWALYGGDANQEGQLSGAHLDAFQAWKISQGRGRIYVIDTGLASADPDLKDRIVGGYDAINDDDNPEDQHGHGSHVASIVAAPLNSQGVSGVAPGPGIEIVDVRFLDANRSGKLSDAVRAWDFVREDLEEYFFNNPDGHAIIVNSYGSKDYSNLLFGRIKAALDVRPSQTLGFAAAGNDGTNNDELGFYPCSYLLYSWACIAASDRSDYLANFSNFGPESVFAMAPGVDIHGVVLGSGSGSSYVPEYGNLSGTSQAVPHAAGVASLVWGANPQLSSNQVLDIMAASVDRLPGAESEVMTGGRINAYRSVLMATGQDPDLANSLNERGKGGGCSLQAGKTFNPLILFILFGVGVLCVNLNKGRCRRRKDTSLHIIPRHLDLEEM